MAWWPFSKTKIGTALEAAVVLIRSLLQRIGRLEEEVQELQGRLAQDSHNSHRPPASDGLGKPPPKSLRRPSGRKPGGQTGHPGRTVQRVQESGYYGSHRVGSWPICVVRR